MISGIFARCSPSRTDPQLHVREYVRVSDEHVERFALAYHYQDASGSLRFRYDNAQHRPPVVSIVHKHVGQDLLPAEGVTLIAVKIIA